MLKILRKIIDYLIADYYKKELLKIENKDEPNKIRQLNCLKLKKNLEAILAD